MSFNGTPKRARPAAGEAGSTPFRSQSSNRFRSSLVPMSRQAASPGPSRSGAAGQPVSSKLTGFSTNQRDLFRTTSTPKAQPFAPELSPAATSKNAGARKFAPQRSVLGGMNTTGAKDLFPMRIPSPDPELSGEALSQQVPDDHNRAGSVYADQYLADKCPTHFDDLQRRQFFCILDLRRLKYAADEIFIKKDWKLNILAFAKEYEKSRSIILLRYGLYEFKNVKPDPSTMRKWRLANGLPELPEDEGTDSRRSGAAGAGKRKAVEDLAGKDSAFNASTSNKRRNVAADGSDSFPSSKRRAVDEDEQRSTPSAATSAFAKILDKTQTPAKAMSSPFSNQNAQKQTESAAPKSNPFQPASTGGAFAALASSIFSNPAKGASDGSILSSHKVGTVPTNTSGIFSYLSESSNNSGNEVDDDEADEPEDEEEEEAEEEEQSEPTSQNEPDSQEAAPSYNNSAAVSTGTNTPPIQSGTGLFPASTKSSTPNIFGASTQSNGVAAKGGLFGRVKLGSDGQPVRATPGPEDKENSTVGTQQGTPAKPAGGNFTFDATKSPISFGAPSSKPASAEPQSASTEPPKFGVAPSAKPAPLFGAPKDAKAASSPLFGPLSNPPDNTATKPASGATPLFGAPKSVTPTPSAAPLFGHSSQPKESAASKPEDTATSIFAGFGSKSSTPTPAAPMFGAPQSKKRGADGEDEPSAKRQAPGEASKSSSASLFGASAPSFGSTQSNGQASQPATALFGTTAKPASSAPIFPTSGSSAPAGKPEVATQQKPLFGMSASVPSATPEPSKPVTAPLFGSTTSSEKTFQFGGSQPAPAPAKPADAPATSIFANPAPSSGGIFSFGGSAPQAAADNKPSTPSFTFGGAKPSEPAAPAAPSFSFGGSTNNASPAVSFGATPTGAGSQSFDFNFGGNQTGGASSTFSFGAGGGGGNTGGSGASSFTFSAGGNNSAPISNPFAQANGAGASAPMFGGGASTTAPAKPATSFNFGASSSQANPAQSSSIFGSQPNGSSTTNGGPSFSFTQATPQRDSGTPKPLGLFASLVPPGGEGSTRGGSPMPAPSSIGTTPVNGTPEPQTQDDGDAEAPQEQLSLTEGGPGEEDETIVHEVRAKAIKFIPINKDADDDDARKSPWSTQGVGPLRVLKNKTTGTVRLLLRAEPRGHIALNKALLSDASYTAKDKTVNLMTSDDKGTSLETWVLQVKKPEFANELAAILEANKSANKK